MATSEVGAEKVSGEPSTVSVSDLKLWLRREDVDMTQCVEKNDLVALWEKIKPYSLLEMEARWIAQQPKKVVFLDVDGVLNCTNTFSTQILPDKIQLVQRLLSRTNAVVVISSSWRDPPARRRFLIQVLEKNGISVDCFVGQTPDITFIERNQEIEQWLDAHPGVEHFCVLDDFAYEWKERVLPKVIRTNEIVGITEHDIERAERILL